LVLIHSYVDSSDSSSDDEEEPNNIDPIPTALNLAPVPTVDHFKSDTVQQTPRLYRPSPGAITQTPELLSNVASSQSIPAAYIRTPPENDPATDRPVVSNFESEETLSAKVQEAETHEPDGKQVSDGTMTIPFRLTWR
jgi:hypothetical protein